MTYRVKAYDQCSNTSPTGKGKNWVDKFSGEGSIKLRKKIYNDA
jgi:hypothetical protein